MHLSPAVAWAAVRSKAVVLVLLTFCLLLLPLWESVIVLLFCCMLLYVHSSIAIILMGKRELVALLNLSSWCLVMVERLFLTVPRGCLRFVIVVFPDHTHLLFFITWHNMLIHQNAPLWNRVSHPMITREANANHILFHVFVWPKYGIKNILDFELKKVLLPPPPPLGNFADISYLEKNFKPHLLRDGCTLCSGALVSDSLLHMLL